MTAREPCDRLNVFKTTNGCSSDDCRLALRWTCESYITWMLRAPNGNSLIEIVRISESSDENDATNIVALHLRSFNLRFDKTNDFIDHSVKEALHLVPKQTLESFVGRRSTKQSGWEIGR